MLEPTQTRRTVMASATAALALPAQAKVRDRFEDPSSKGVAGYSESSMVVFVDPVRQVAASLRICRFPDLGLSWLWCHALTPKGFCGYAHHAAPCGPEHLFARADQAAFDAKADGARASLRRSGSDQIVSGVTFDAKVAFQDRADFELGPGRSGGRFHGAFTPTHLHQGQFDAGRREQVGVMEAELEIAGSRFTLRGPAKYHEQAQVTPRFVDAFSYLAYWGAQSSGVAIRTLTNSSGATLEGPKAAAVVGFRATPPADQRRFELARRGTEPLSGELTTLTRFSLPIFGERWQGTFVRGRAGSDPVVGMFNSWRAEGLSDLA